MIRYNNTITQSRKIVERVWFYWLHSVLDFWPHLRYTFAS